MAVIFCCDALEFATSDNFFILLGRLPEGERDGEFRPLADPFVLD